MNKTCESAAAGVVELAVEGRAAQTDGVEEAAETTAGCKIVVMSKVDDVVTGAKEPEVQSGAVESGGEADAETMLVLEVEEKVFSNARRILVTGPRELGVVEAGTVEVTVDVDGVETAVLARETCQATAGRCLLGGGVRCIFDRRRRRRRLAKSKARKSGR